MHLHGNDNNMTNTEFEWLRFVRRVQACDSEYSRNTAYLWFARVVVGLDEDLSQSDVFAHGHQSLLHRLSRSQDGNSSDLQKIYLLRHTQLII